VDEREHMMARDLLGPYVLGALDPEEELVVEDHLQRCAACRTEERELRQAHEHLSELMGVRETPPPEIKGSVMSGLPRRRTLREMRRAPIFAAAAALITLSLVVIFSSGLLNRDAMASATLESTPLAPEAGGELRVRADDPNARATLEVWNMPNCKKDEYYELWFGEEGGRVSAGTFKVDERGQGTLQMSVPEEAGNYGQVGITLEEFPEEPRMDSAKPVLTGELEGS
jgi:hypothetical protein